MKIKDATDYIFEPGAGIEITKVTIHKWMQQGIFTPENHAAKRDPRGSDLSFEDLVALCIIKTMTECRMTFDQIRRWMGDDPRRMQKVISLKPEFLYILICLDGIKSLEATLPKTHLFPYVTIHVPTIAAEVRQRMKEYEAGRWELRGKDDMR